MVPDAWEDFGDAPDSQEAVRKTPYHLRGLMEALAVVSRDLGNVGEVHGALGGVVSGC